MFELSDLVEWFYIEAFLDEYLFGGERGLRCEIFFVLNLVVGVELSGSYRGGVEWGEEEFSRFYFGEWG